MPPCRTLGQLTLISSSPTCPQPSSRAATSAYSSTEKPPTLATTGLRKKPAMRGSSCLTTASTPGFCNPTALSNPSAHSAMRGVGLPKRGSRVVPFMANDPSTFRSYNAANSAP